MNIKLKKIHREYEAKGGTNLCECLNELMALAAEMDHGARVSLRFNSSVFTVTRDEAKDE